MTEDKKYYPARPSELHVGLECYIAGRKNDQDVLEKHVLTQGDLLKGFPYVIYLKHLDREDIEGLGFNQAGEYNPLTEKSYGKNYALSFSKTGPPISLWYANTGFRCHIWQAHMVYFQGTIKHISEFKTILRQVGVIK